MSDWLIGEGCGRLPSLASLPLAPAAERQYVGLAATVSSRFTGVQIGPFASAYHRGLAQDELRSAICSLLDSDVLPQVQAPFDSASGKLTAEFEDERYTGPNSAVRNLFNLELSLNRASKPDTLRAALRYDPSERTFAPRRSPLYLWTVARSTRFREEELAIRKLCSRLSETPADDAACPRCGSRVEPHVGPAQVEISCPSRCFRFGFHRVPETGEFLHGHFFQSDPSY